VDPAAATAGRTVWFLGAAVMTGRRGPDDGDCQVDGVVPRHGGDSGGGGSREGGGLVLTVDEERDGGWGGGGVDSATPKREWEILAA
jgi:hypothetical protein